MSKVNKIILTKDQDVMVALHQYMADKNWKAGVIVAGVGSIYNVKVANPGSYDMPPQMLEISVNNPCEIVSFMGEIIRKEDAPADLPCQFKDTPSPYIIHIHMAFSHGNGIVNGGGFRSATVLRAINVYVIEIE